MTARLHRLDVVTLRSEMYGWPIDTRATIVELNATIGRVARNAALLEIADVDGSTAAMFWAPLDALEKKTGRLSVAGEKEEK